MTDPIGDKQTFCEFSGQDGVIVEEQDGGPVIRRLLRDQGGLGKKDPGDEVSEPLDQNDPVFQQALRNFNKIKSDLRNIDEELKRGALKPEAALTRVKGLVAKYPQASPRLRSEMQRTIFGIEGELADKASFFAALRHGKATKAAIQKALEEDPDNAAAWQDYGLFLAGVDQNGSMAESALGIDVTAELARAATGLAREKDAVRGQLILVEVLRRLAKRSRGLSEALRTVRAEVEAALPALVAAQPEVAEQTRAELARVRK